jgi:hypothetical protein
MPTYVSILRIPRMILESDGGMIYCQGKTEELGEKPVPAPLCPPQIPHGLTRARTRASAVRSTLRPLLAVETTPTSNRTNTPITNGPNINHQRTFTPKILILIHSIPNLPRRHASIIYLRNQTSLKLNILNINKNITRFGGGSNNSNIHKYVNQEQ